MERAPRTCARPFGNRLHLDLLLAALFRPCTYLHVPAQPADGPPESTSKTEGIYIRPLLRFSMSIPLQAIQWQTARQQAVPLVHCFAWWLSEAIVMANANHRREQQKTTRTSRRSGAVTAGHLAAVAPLSAFYKPHTRRMRAFRSPPSQSTRKCIGRSSYGVQWSPRCAKGFGALLPATYRDT